MRAAIVATCITLSIPSIWAQHTRNVVSRGSLTPSGAGSSAIKRGALAARVQKRASDGVSATLAQAPGVVQLHYFNGTLIGWFVNTRTIPKGSSIALSVVHDNGSAIDSDPLTLDSDLPPGQSYLLPNVSTFGDLWSSGVVTYVVYVTINGQETQAAADFAVGAARNYSDLQKVSPLIASASQAISSAKDVVLTIRGAFIADAPYVALDDSIVPASAITASTRGIDLNLSKVPGLDLTTFWEFALTVGQGGWSDTMVYRYVPAAPGTFNQAP
jgi:hypothetical protein